jgi:hypothetical protein
MKRVVLWVIVIALLVLVTAWSQTSSTACRVMLSLKDASSIRSLADEVDIKML